MASPSIPGGVRAGRESDASPRIQYRDSIRDTIMRFRESRYHDWCAVLRGALRHPKINIVYICIGVKKKNATPASTQCPL